MRTRSFLLSVFLCWKFCFIYLISFEHYWFVLFFWISDEIRGILVMLVSTAAAITEREREERSRWGEKEKREAGGEGEMESEEEKKKKMLAIRETGG